MEPKSIEELNQLNNVSKAYCLIAISAAKSGHPGGCLSSMEILTTLYQDQMNHDPQDPQMEDRDRLIVSKGHIAPAVYVAQAMAGYYSMEEVMSFRKLGSPFQGHPNTRYLNSLEISSGSLGQGLGVAVGTAIGAKLKDQKHKIYCLMGDGEQQEGNIWESAMSAAHYQLDNLVGIVDHNKLQIDGSNAEVMGINPIGDKYQAFGWHVIEIDGNNILEIQQAFSQANQVAGKPTVIIANTIKGKGVKAIENRVEWHSGHLYPNQLISALEELGCDQLPYTSLLAKSQHYATQVAQVLDNAMPRFGQDYWWNHKSDMRVNWGKMNAGLFDCLEQIGKDSRVVVVPSDSNYMISKGFGRNNPKRSNRVINVGIAEQNMATVAAGLAKEGFIPFMGGYSIFSPGRNWDQIRTSICLGKLNVKMIGVGGLVGQDGGSHEGLEDIPMMQSLPDTTFSMPSDYLEARRTAEHIILEIDGPSFMRIGKTDMPILTTEDTPYQFGTANIIRFRQAQPQFVDAFETMLSTNYSSEKEDLTIVSAGLGVSEAMRAAYILSQEKSLQTRVINLHTLKPLDRTALVQAAQDTKLMVTVEEHQKGGLGNIVAGAISDLDKRSRLEMIGVEDKFGESGTPYELVKKFGLTAEHIAAKVLASLE